MPEELNNYKNYTTLKCNKCSPNSLIREIVLRSHSQRKKKERKKEKKHELLASFVTFISGAENAG